MILITNGFAIALILNVLVVPRDLCLLGWVPAYGLSAHSPHSAWSSVWRVAKTLGELSGGMRFQVKGCSFLEIGEFRPGNCHAKES